MHFSARFFSAIGVLLLLILSSVYSFLPSKVYAQQEIPVNTQTATNSFDNTVAPTVSNLAQGVMWGFLSFASCAIDGRDVTSPQQGCLGYNSKTGQLTRATTTNQGLLGLTNSGIALLFSPPQFHVGNYVSYVAGNFGAVKSANAASGTGFDQLAPVMKLWLAFRNVAYLLFVIVFVVVGFAIMLRAKIDPRTVMTIENQIPKIIVALILVTFSYAIAGFVIDIMWLATFITINLFSTLDPALQPALMTANISTNPITFLDTVYTGGILGMIVQPAASIYDINVGLAQALVQNAGWMALPGIIPCFLGSIGNAPQQLLGSQGAFGFLPLPLRVLALPASVPQAIGNAVAQPILGNFGAVANLIFGNHVAGAVQLATNAADSPLVSCIKNGFTDGISSIAGIVAFFIFAFALLFALLRMYFSLLKSYVLFLLYAILGPFFILLGVLPGTSINFDNWLRHLLAYSLVFPYAIGIILLGRVISDVYLQSKTGFVPPLIGVPNGVSQFMGPLIGFGIILLLPQALTMLQDALKAPDIKYLPGVGQMLAQGTQAYSSIVSQPWKRLTRHQDTVRGLSEGGLRKWFMNIPTPFGKMRKLAGENEPGLNK